MTAIMFGLIAIAWEGSFLSRPENLPSVPVLSTSQVQRRLAIAEAFAPIIFQEEKPEDIRALTGFNPVDHLVALDFEDDFDFRNNSERIFKLTPRQEEGLLQKPIVYFSVIETEAFTYINYMLYRAVDLGANTHSHDTENVWVIVSQPKKLIEAVITNAHGLAMIYSPDKRTQRRLRASLPSDRRRRFLKWIDPTAAPHHENPSFEIVREKASQHALIYSCPRTHALYKLDRSIVASKGTRVHGRYYAPRGCVDFCRTHLEGYRRYHLVDFDAWLLKTVDAALLGTISLDQWKAMFSGESAMETATFEIHDSNSWSMPAFPAPALSESRAAAGFYFRSSMGFKGELMDPARKHLVLDPFNRDIALNYKHHPYRAPAVHHRREYSMGLWDLLRSLKSGLN